MSLDLGRLAHDYDVLTKLKDGGMGAVYKVLHRQLDEALTSLVADAILAT
jgi:hypothetical protein